MIRAKKYIINTLLLFIILDFAFLPIILSNIREQRLLNKLYIEKIGKNKPAASLLMSVEDKLDLMANSYMKDKNIVIIEKKEQQLRIDEISSLAINELKKLQNLGIFPNVNLENKLEAVNYSLTTYMDKNKLQDAVTIWHASFLCDEYRLYISMDFRTYKIYEFYVYSNYEIPKTDVTSMPRKILQYLDVEWDDNNEYYYHENEAFILRGGKVTYGYSTDNKHTNLYLLTNKESQEYNKYIYREKILQ